jgi:hypothetical protein
MDSYFQALRQCKTKREYHALVQHHFRLMHKDYYKEYMRTYMKRYYHLHKKTPCQHISSVSIDANTGQSILVCSVCGTLLMKSGF